MGKGVGLFNYVIYITNAHPKKKKKRKRKRKRKKTPNKVSIIAEICIFGTYVYKEP